MDARCEYFNINFLNENRQDNPIILRQWTFLIIFLPGEWLISWMYCCKDLTINAKWKVRIQSIINSKDMRRPGFKNWSTSHHEDIDECFTRNNFRIWHQALHLLSHSLGMVRWDTKEFSLLKAGPKVKKGKNATSIRP